jgi:hypothetical protein
MNLYQAFQAAGVDQLYVRGIPSGDHLLTDPGPPPPDTADLATQRAWSIVCVGEDFLQKEAALIASVGGNFESIYQGPADEISARADWAALLPGALASLGLPLDYQPDEADNRFALIYCWAGLIKLFGRVFGLATPADVIGVEPGVDFTQGLADGEALPGETLAGWTLRHTRPDPANPSRFIYVSPHYDAAGHPLPAWAAFLAGKGAPPPSPAPPSSMPHATESAADHQAIVTAAPPILPPHIVAAPADIHALVGAAWQLDWPLMRPALIAAGHGTLVIAPPVRQAILAAVYPRYVALAQAGLIGADGRLAG